MSTINVYRGGVVVAQAIVDPDIAEKHGKYKWELHAKSKKENRESGYVRRTTRRSHAGPVVAIYLHRLVAGVEDPQTHVDHKNGNKLDNRRDNLEPVSGAVNMYRMHNRVNGKVYEDPHHNVPAEPAFIEPGSQPTYEGIPITFVPKLDVVNVSCDEEINQRQSLDAKTDVHTIASTTPDVPASPVLSKEIRMSNEKTGKGVAKAAAANTARKAGINVESARIAVVNAKTILRKGERSDDDAANAIKFLETAKTEIDAGIAELSK